MSTTPYPERMTATEGAEDRGHERFHISLRPARVTVWLVGIYLMLLLAHVTGLVFTYGLGHGRLLGLVHVFNLSAEQNLPTLFATALLFLDAALLFLLYRVTPPSQPRTAWLLLALIFSFLAVDEFAVIHEQLIVPMRMVLERETYGLLYYAWVIPYGIAAAALGLLLLPTLLRLPPRFRALFVASGATYVAGAIGVEMIGGYYYEALGEVRDLTHRLITTVEESLEFAGLILFAYALLSLLETICPRLMVTAAFRR